MTKTFIEPAATVRQRIVDDVIAGTLAFGERVTIARLCHRYASTHMPVREALRELAGEGLVLIERNRGARIRPVDRAFVACMFDTRGALEIMLTRRATSLRSEADCETLERIESELESQVDEGDAAGVHDANRRLHHALYVAARNPDALAVVRRYWVINAALWQRFGYAPERFAGMVRDHRHLLRAVRDGDAEAAGAIVAAHVIKARQELLARIDAAAIGSASIVARAA